jgi:hypothetical protein
MSKLTDRIDNQNIINLAREQYETQQRGKLPSVIVPLTSAGKIYPKTSLLSKGTVEMRYMTAYDEDILTNASYIQNAVVFEKLLESIILTPISVDEISVVDKLGLIINARILAYGSEYEVEVTDPKTQKRINRSIDLRKLKVKPFKLQPNDNGEFSYQVNSECTIWFRYPTRDSEDDTVSAYLKNIITQVNESRDANSIENFIRYEFLAADSKRFRKYVSENAPTLDLNVELEGEDGSTFTTGFPIGPQLFWF